SWRPMLVSAPAPARWSPVAMRFVSPSELSIVAQKDAEARVDLGATVRVVAEPSARAGRSWSVALAADGAALIASNEFDAAATPGPPTVRLATLGKTIALVVPPMKHESPA